MKKIFLFAAALCFSTLLIAQTKGSVKLYGYKQPVSGGKAPEPSTDTGLRVSRRSGNNYFIYAVSSSRIYPLEIWLEGNRYGVTVKSIKKTPVEYSNEMNVGSPKKILVPKTTKEVLQLIPMAADAGAKSAGVKAKSLSTQNEAVAVYKQNGKFYYNTLKRLSDLESVSMQ